MLRRSHWVWLHRWAGLYMAAFLVVAGLTGSVLAFAPELQRWLVPPPKVQVRTTPMLDGLTLRERALALAGPGFAIHGVELQRRAPDEPYTAWLTPVARPAGPNAEVPPNGEIDHIRLDPYTGEEIGRGQTPRHGLWPITRENIVSVIVALHYRLAVPGSIGTWLFGIAALLWTIDCFVSAYLTFPLHARRVATPTGALKWMRRWWKPSWLVRWWGSGYRVTFDLHRAGGLWLWVLLLALAWSSVGFNLRHAVYLPVMEGLFGYRDVLHELPRLAQPTPAPEMTWPDALRHARQLMAEQTRLKRFAVVEEMSLDFDPATGTFSYWIRSDRDIIDTSVMTYLVFRSVDGSFLGMVLPTGDRLGNTLNTWAGALHMAMLWGLPYKVFLAVAGVAIAFLAVSGVVIWWRKRHGRHRVRRFRILFGAPR